MASTTAPFAALRANRSGDWARILRRGSYSIGRTGNGDGVSWMDAVWRVGTI